MNQIPQFRSWTLCLWILALALPLYAADPGLKVPELDARKAAVVKPPPEYPLAARQFKIGGRVEVEAVVSESGEVEEARIKSGNPILARAATDAVKKWKFHPFVVDGKAERAVVSLIFEFTSR